MSRKKATDFIVKLYSDMEKGKGMNAERVRIELDSMSDKAFEKYVEALEKGEDYLVFIAPVGQRPALDKEHLMKLGEERLGIKWRQRVWRIDQYGNEVLTPNEYLLLHQPVRRQSQRLEKKRGVPENSNVVDDLTNQPTGASKGSALSFNQIQVLSGQGLDKSILESIKYRGGDAKGFNALNNIIYSKGSVSLAELEQHAGGVKSVKTASIYLTCMHLANTL